MEPGRTFLDSLRGTGLKTRLLHPLDEFWDRRLGIRTTLGHHVAGGADGKIRERVHYAPTPYQIIFRLLRHVGLSHDDVMVDFGSGLGRAVFAASRMGARRSIGVEVDESLHAIACSNLRKSRLKGRDIEFACTPAENYRGNEATVIYMFHPFREATMTSVIKQLELSILDKHRNLRIAYLNPVCEDVLERSGFLQRVDSWTASGFDFLRGGKYAASFWAATKAR